MSRSLAALVLAGIASALGGEAHRRTVAGNDRYKHGEHDKALEEYQRAGTAAPYAPEVPYDIGNVLYRQENWAGAADAYQKALGSAGSTLAPQAAFNLGNALFKDEKYDDAVKAYVRALKAAPSDGDAKRNLEWALRALQEQKQKQQQQQKQDQKQEQKDQRPKPQGGEGKGDEKPKEGGDKGSQPPKQAQKPGGMSPEEAAKLLDRVGDKERDNLKHEKARAVEPARDRRLKDW